MKDPSASPINVNKYFPQPTSIRIKEALMERESEKNQLVGSFAQKTEEGEKYNLSSTLNNEACFQQNIEGRGGKNM